MMLTSLNFQTKNKHYYDSYPRHILPNVPYKLEIQKDAFINITKIVTYSINMICLPFNYLNRKEINLSYEKE